MKLISVDTAEIWFFYSLIPIVNFVTIILLIIGVMFKTLFIFVKMIFNIKFVKSCFHFLQNIIFKRLKNFVIKKEYNIKDEM